MTVKLKELLNQARKINKLLLDAHHKAQQPCVGVKAKTSTTPPNRFFDILEQELRMGTPERKQALEDLELMLKSVAEKRRLTVEWRGGMMSHSELIKATAKRVGLAPPELQSDKKPSS